MNRGNTSKPPARQARPALILTFSPAGLVYHMAEDAPDGACMASASLPAGMIAANAAGALEMLAGLLRVATACYSYPLGRAESSLPVVTKIPADARKNTNVSSGRAGERSL